MDMIAKKQDDSLQFLYRVILLLQTQEECERFFDDLCTGPELKALAQRLEVAKLLKEQNVKVAIGSSSRNTPIILRQIGLSDAFDAIADGNAIRNSKPDPEVFLLAARLLGLAPANCLVVEDADAGVQAALTGGMRALGVGSAAANPTATFHAQSLQTADFASILNA